MTRKSNLIQTIRLTAALTLAVAFAVTFAGAAFQEDFRALYKERRYERAVELLEDRLDFDPSDDEARMNLVLTLLRMEEREFALSQLQRLRDAGTQSALRYAEQLERLIAHFDVQAHNKELLEVAMDNLDRRGAISAIDTMDMSPEQKAIVRMYVEMYAGDFDAARANLGQFKPQRFSDHKKVEAMRNEIDETEARYAELITIVADYYYSGDSTSTFGLSWADKVPAVGGFSVEGYLDTVNALAALAPLSPRVMDATFHAAMLVAPYEQLAEVGRKILDARGSLHIPFFSRDTHFDLVIDAVNGRLRTEIRDIPFRATHTRKGANKAQNPCYLPLTAFDVAFAAIGKIEQKTAHHYGIEGLDDRSFVLKLKSGGVAPNYALMPALHMNYGEKAQKQATRNLGQFVVDTAAAGGAGIQAKLVNPEKKTTNKKKMFANVMSGISATAGSYASATGDYGSAAQLNSTARDFQEDAVQMTIREDALAEMFTSRSTAIVQRGFDFALESEYVEVESLLGLD